MSFETDRIEQVRHHSAKDLSEHVIRVVQSKGLHRHWRCRKPGTGVYGFDIITWPGYLCICGDMGDFVFARTSDMLAFMRGACMSFSYAAEKCVAQGREGVKEWDRAILDEALDYRLTEYEEDSDEIAKLREKIEELKDDRYESEHDAMEAMYESQLWGCELPDCRTYTFHFLWCMFAIKWFCDKIDAGEYIRYPFWHWVKTKFRSSYGQEQKIVATLDH